MIKAIFFDLDGTLLTSQKLIGSKTQYALMQCKEKGIKLFVATARPPLLNRMLSWDEDCMALFEGGVYYNGGCIVWGNEKEYHFISDEVVREAIRLVCEYDELNIVLQLEDEKHAFRFPLTSGGLKSWGLSREDCLCLSENLITIKILVFTADLIDSSSPIDNKLIIALQALCCDKAQFYLTDEKKSVQIMGKGINKLKGIEYVCRKAGYEKDEIAVFGDDINDIEMLSAFRYSFAMGNASNMVKEQAKYITLDNDSEGVYHATHNMLQIIG